MNFKFIAQPRDGRLEQITKWLQEEKANTGTGFHCNISVINKAFKDKEAFCVTVKNEAIGFCIVSPRGCTARIEIAEVCPAFRGSGAGRFMVENCLNTLTLRGVQVVDLECKPTESESFWRFMGFCSIPDGVDVNSFSAYNKPIKLFRPVCPAQEEILLKSSENVIELYDCEPWASRNRLPRWTWPVLTQDNSNMLKKPIIHPANEKWHIRWKNGDTIVKEGKVQSFSSDSENWGRYVILTKLPVLK